MKTLNLPTRLFALPMFLFVSVVCQPAELKAFQDANEAAETDVQEEEEMLVEGVMAFDPFGGQASRGQMIALKKLDVLLELDMKIEELQAVCGINDKDVQKLRVASKGIAKRQAKDWAKIMEEYQMMSPEEDNKEEEEVEEINFDRLDPNLVQWLNVGWFGETDLKAPTEDKLWTKAMNSVLSDEQTAKLDQIKKARQENTAKATTEFITQLYGNQLLLNEEQMGKFRALVDEKIKEQPAISTVDETWNLMAGVAQIGPNELREFVTENQLKRWKIITAMYGQMFFDEEIIEEELDAIEDEDN